MSHNFHTGKFSPHLKVKLEFTLVLLISKLTLVLLNLFLNKNLDSDQLVSFIDHLITINTVFHTKIQVSAEHDKIWMECSI